jgi:hypothetical protein
MYGENKHAPRTSVYTMSERSFEASGAGARSGIPRWSGNTLREGRYEVLARPAAAGLASGGIPPGLISCKHPRVIGYRMLGDRPKNRPKTDLKPT